MSTTWILVANSSQAKLYEAHRGKLFNTNGNASKGLRLLKEFHHKESRIKNSERLSDRLGNYHAGPYGHGTFVESSDPKENEANRFAHDLTMELNSGRLEHSYDDVVIVANPHFQGLIRDHMNIYLSRLVSSSVEKDYTQLDNRALVHQLQEKIC